MFRVKATRKEREGTRGRRLSEKGQGGGGSLSNQEGEREETRGRSLTKQPGRREREETRGRRLTKQPGRRERRDQGEEAH